MNKGQLSCGLWAEGATPVHSRPLRMTGVGTGVGEGRRRGCSTVHLFLSHHVPACYERGSRILNLNLAFQVIMKVYLSR